MLKVCVLLFAFFTCSLATFGDLSSNVYNSITSNGPEWYIGGMRGLWFGFYRGFFHEQKTPESQCLSDGAKDEMVGLVHFVMNGELSDIFSVYDDAKTLYYNNKDHCGQWDIIQTVKSKCTDQDCNFVKLLGNLFAKNVFETLGDISVVVDSVLHFRFTGLTKEQIYEQTLSLGKHLGSLIASVIDIHGDEQ